MIRPDLHIELTEEQFLERFTMIPNHIDHDARKAKERIGSCLFGISGPELEFVKRFDPRKVWTLLETDEGELSLASGFYYSNRVAFLLTNQAVELQVTISVLLNSSPSGQDWAKAKNLYFSVSGVI